jgi:hypothetical protein
MQNIEKQPIVDVQILKEKACTLKQSIEENAAFIIILLLAIIVLITFVRMVADLKRTRELGRLRYECDCGGDYDDELDFEYMDRGN